MFVQVPTAAASLGPHGRAQLFLQAVVVPGLRLLRRLERQHLVTLHIPERPQDVIDLRLDNVDDRVVTEARVGADQHKEVRKPRDGGAV